MTEYTITLLNVNLALGTITVLLTPQGSPELSPIKRTVRITSDRLTQILALSTETEMLDEFRFEIVKYNTDYQAIWAQEQATRSLSIPEGLMNAVGVEFFAVTETEALNARTRAQAEAEVI